MAEPYISPWLMQQEQAKNSYNNAIAMQQVRDNNLNYNAMGGAYQLLAALAAQSGQPQNSTDQTSPLPPGGTAPITPVTSQPLASLPGIPNSGPASPMPAGGGVPPTTNVPMPGAMPMQAGGGGAAMPNGFPQADLSKTYPTGSPNSAPPPQTPAQLKMIADTLNNGQSRTGGGSAPASNAMPSNDPNNQPAPSTGGGSSAGSGTDSAAGAQMTPQDEIFFHKQLLGPNGDDVKQLIKAAKTAMPDATPTQRMAAVKEALNVVNSSTSSIIKQVNQQLAMTRLQNAQGGQATPDEIKFLADEVASGNQGILARMPPGVRLSVAQELQNRGISGTDASNSTINYHGKMSESSAAGRRTGNIDVALSGVEQIVPDALEASSKVPRSSWLVAGKMGNWLREQTNDPDLAQFQVFNLGLAREYAQAFGGTKAANDHALDVLGASKSQEAYYAAAQALQKEVRDAQKGGKSAMQNITSGGAGTPDAVMGDQPSAGGPSPPPGFVVQ